METACFSEMSVDMHDVVLQKIELFIATDVKT
jgi:hypothetical protein